MPVPPNPDKGKSNKGNGGKKPAKKSASPKRPRKWWQIPWLWIAVAGVAGLFIFQVFFAGATRIIDKPNMRRLPKRGRPCVLIFPRILRRP